MAYVDGFVIAIPKRNIAAYRRIAQKASRIWQDHGALDYRECVGEDLNVKVGTPFPRLLGLKRGETVVFSWITYRSRAHRDQVNAKVMKDPRLSSMPESMPFDMKRMVYGGFDTLVELGAPAPRRRGSRRRARTAERRGDAEASRTEAAAH